METVTVVKTAGMGIGGAGVVGATGYGAYSLIKPKTIREQLKWDGFDLLDTEGTTDDTTWTSHADSYLDTANSKNKFPGLDNITVTGTENKKDKLKNKCKEELKKKLEEDSDGSIFNAAKDWCVKKKTASANVA